MSLTSKLKFKFFVAKKSIGYSKNFLERTYQIYLNHNKIIHWRDGYPVCSLSTPAIYSQPSANLFARSVFSNIQNRKFPNLLSFAINDICNVKCEHCSFFTSVHDNQRPVLTLDQCRQVIHEAQELGVSVINIVGGEPLLHPELTDILESINKDLSTVTLFTNGLLLADQAAALRRAGLDSVYVSLDYADAAKHDQRRGKPGLFNKALAGIAAAKRAGLSVGISTTITEDEFRNGELADTFELAKKLKVHEVLIFDMIPVGRAANRTELYDKNAWIEELIKLTKKYNEDDSYPGILVYAYATSYRSTGCSGGTSYFYVSPYGDIYPCDFHHRSFGNIKEEPLYKIWDKMSSHEDFAKASWNGCKMKDSVYVQAAAEKHSGCNGCSACS